MFIKYLRYLPLLGVCSVIFYFSSISGLKSDFVPVLDIILRKLAHMYEYLILYLAAIFAFYDRKVALFEGNKYMESILWGVFVFSVLFAISDELHQLFVVERSGKVIDLVYDMIGIYGGYILVELLVYFYRDEKRVLDYDVNKFSV